MPEMAFGVRTVFAAARGLFSGDDGMERRLFFGGVLLLLWGVSASCSDATSPGPAPTLTFTVTPNTVGYSADSIVDLWFYRRNVSDTPLQFWSIESEIQSEVIPGAWTTVKSSGPYHFWPPNVAAEKFEVGANIGGVWSFKISSGRYRLHYTFEMAKSDGRTPSGDRRSVDSNPFVVIGS